MAHDRRFWMRVVSVAEESERSHAEIAARFGVRLTTLRTWIYRLRRERERGDLPEPRLLPVRVTAMAAAPDGIEIEAGGVTVRVPSGCEPEYVARLVRAVRAC